MTNKIKNYYAELFKKHGNSPAAVQHISTEDQYKRFDVLCSDISKNTSIIDVGCGLGDMLSYLRAKGFQGKYLGLDFVNEFIQHNKKFFNADLKANFMIFDILKDEFPKGYEQIILSGVFNNIIDNNEYFAKTTLQKMFNASTKQISFNMMSTYVDYTNDNLFYYNPLDIFDFCKRNLSKHLLLKHDYGLGQNQYPYEFSIFVRKEG